MSTHLHPHTYTHTHTLLQYTLTVRSPLFCDLLEDLDSDGIPTL